MKTKTYALAAVCAALSAIPRPSAAVQDPLPESGETTEAKRCRTADEFAEEYDRVRKAHADDPARQREELRKLEIGRLAELREQHGEDLEAWLSSNPETDGAGDVRELLENERAVKALEDFARENGIDDIDAWLAEHGDDDSELARKLREYKEAVDEAYSFLSGDEEVEFENWEAGLDGENGDDAAVAEARGKAIDKLLSGFKSNFNAADASRTIGEANRIAGLLGDSSAWGAEADRIAGGGGSGRGGGAFAASNAVPDAAVPSGQTRGLGAEALLAEEDSGVGADDDDRELTLDDLPEDASKYFDEMTFGSLEWEFGGLDGSGADGSKVLIGGLEMRKDGLKFEYDTDLSSWGLGETQYEGGDHGGAIACLFVLDNDGKWVGGKFDWISSSRKTRDFANIQTGYNGWNLSNVPKSTTAAFVIVSADGKRRSNVITARWDR